MKLVSLRTYYSIKIYKEVSLHFKCRLSGKQTQTVIRKAGNISIKFIDYRKKKQFATVNLVNTQIYCTKLQCKCLCIGKIIFTIPLYLQAINYTISQLYYTYRLSTMFFILTMGHWQPRTQTACVYIYCIQAYTGKIFFYAF